MKGSLFTSLAILGLTAVPAIAGINIDNSDGTVRDNNITVCGTADVTLNINNSNNYIEYSVPEGSHDEAQVEIDNSTNEIIVLSSECFKPTRASDSEEQVAYKDPVSGDVFINESYVEIVQVLYKGEPYTVEEAQELVD